MAPNGRQVIIWANAEPNHWRIYAALGKYELIIIDMRMFIQDHTPHMPPHINDGHKKILLALQFFHLYQRRWILHERQLLSIAQTRTRDAFDMTLFCFFNMELTFTHTQGRLCSHDASMICFVSAMRDVYSKRKCVFSPKSLNECADNNLLFVAKLWKFNLKTIDDWN